MIVSRCRDIEEFKRVHAQCENDRIPSVESILALDKYCFCFYRDNGEFVGCIYLEDDEGRVCLSGFAKPKSYDIVIKAIKFISSLFNEDNLYELTNKKSAIMVLLRCGFKKIDDETYLRKAF